MIVFPNCKINLGLRILRNRTDGYHDLETVFYPLPFYDVLEVIPDAGNKIPDPGSDQNKSSVLFSRSGFVINGNTGDNLCIKSVNLLKHDFPQLPRIQMHLHKVIPAGAGLGGGSADAAFTLSLLNKQFQLNLSTRQLINYALQLGSDCPFFIINQPCFAAGRGEILEQITIDLSAYKFIIVNPGIHISTSAAFSGITPALPPKSVMDIIQQPIETWKNELINDFEKIVFKQHTEIETIKNKFYASGAVYSSMSGSGSTVYGIFEKSVITQFDFPSSYFIKEIAAG
ncbi:MAG: 4-(cytidine 5'-diphospho)-2-C-methyl-D-erythritol kinase [Chitinophagaceae bacterium]